MSRNENDFDMQTLINAGITTGGLAFAAVFTAIMATNTSSISPPAFGGLAAGAAAGGMLFFYGLSKLFRSPQPPAVVTPSVNGVAVLFHQPRDDQQNPLLAAPTVVPVPTGYGSDK